MPLRFTDHASKPALEQELRALWAVLDGLNLASRHSNVRVGPGGVASTPPADGPTADGSLMTAFLTMGS